MSNETQNSENQNEVESFILWGVKLFQTKNDENNFVAIKNKMSQKELENNYYDSVNENEDSIKETFTGLKFLTKDDLDEVGINYEKPGQRYNLTFEIEEGTGEETESKAKLVKADKVTIWTDSIQLGMSDVRYSKKQNKPFVVLYYSIKEETFDKAPNKDKFMQGMSDIGLESDLVAYKGWINFNAFVWLFENEVEKIKSYKNRKRQWTLGYEQINDNKKQIKRIYGKTFDKDLLLEGEIIEVSEDKKTVRIEKITNWTSLNDSKSLNLLHFTSDTTYLEDVEKGGDNMKLTFTVDVAEPTSVQIGDIVEIYLNDTNVKKIKSVKIYLQELEPADFFKENSEKIEEIENEIDDDDVPF